MSSNLIKIGDIEKFSIVDFPSKIAAVVFMQGCPWRCPFCYNASLQNPNIEDTAEWDKLIYLLEHRKGILDAVVFSGGEPLMQANLPQAMEQVKALGFEIGLHTGGYNPLMLKKIINKVSWVGLDIKVPLDTERYSKVTGCPTPIENIKESLRILVDSGIHFECRTTCDPRILEITDIYEIAKELEKAGVKEYYLQKYRPIPTDKITTDEACEKFFNNKELIDHLKNIFPIFDVRNR